LPRRWRLAPTWRASQAIRTFTTTFLSRARLRNHHYSPAPRRPSSRGLLTRMRRMSGRSGSRGKLSSLRAPTPVFAGRTTRLNRTTVAGTESTAITTLTGTIPSMTVWAILAGMIRSNLVMISSTARIQPAQRSATMAALIRLEWRPAQNGSVAVTWTRGTAHRRGTSSAWNFSLHLTH